jgi:hypothetical protein
MNKLNIPNTITLKNKVAGHHIIDRRKLILAEIQVNTNEKIS